MISLYSVLVALSLAAGVGFGFLHLALVRHTADVGERGGRTAPTIAFPALRMIAAILFFGILAKLSAAFLLAAFLGFLIARTLAVRSVRRAL